MHSSPLISGEPVGLVDQAVGQSVFKVEYETLPPRKWWDLWSLLFPKVPRAMRVFDLELDFSPVVPGTLVFSFEYEPTHQGWTSCDDGRGVLFGDAAGRIDYETGKYTLTTCKPMPPGTTVFAQYAYDCGRGPASSVTSLRSTPRISASARDDS